MWLFIELQVKDCTHRKGPNLSKRVNQRLHKPGAILQSCAKHPDVGFSQYVQKLNRLWKQPRPQPGQVSTALAAASKAGGTCVFLCGVASVCSFPSPAPEQALRPRHRSKQTGTSDDRKKDTNESQKDTTDTKIKTQAILPGGP